MIRRSPETGSLRTVARLFAAGALLVCLSWGQAFASSIQTVESVDLKRYLGTWYELASIPQWFSKGCVCTRATYKAGSDGEIRILNQCRRETTSAPWEAVNGRAYVVDEKTRAKLKVTFFWPFYGAYWIIGLDPEYRWAVVSNSDGSTLWILARTPTLEKPLLDQAIAAAKAQVDLNELRWMKQEGCGEPPQK